MSRGPDAGTQLERALIQHAAQTGAAVTITAATWDRWASATFTGARHMLECVGARSTGLDAWIAALPDAEFALRGHLLADIAVHSKAGDADMVRFAIEALTVEDK